MGGSQSTPTRKISISNEESHLIKISEAVAERLRKCAEGSPEALKSQEGCEPGEYEKDVRDTQPDPKCR